MRKKNCAYFFIGPIILHQYITRYFQVRRGRTFPLIQKTEYFYMYVIRVWFEKKYNVFIQFHKIYIGIGIKQCLLKKNLVIDFFPRKLILSCIYGEWQESSSSFISHDRQTSMKTSKRETRSSNSDSSRNRWRGKNCSALPNVKSVNYADP